MSTHTHTYTYLYICIPECLHASPETVTALFVNWLYPDTKFKSLKKNAMSYTWNSQNDVWAGRNY